MSTPHLSVNVIDPSAAQSLLEPLCKRFKLGHTDPMIIGSGGKPEAVVIAFSDYLRLCDLDQAHENAFARTLAARRETPAEAFIGLGTILDEFRPYAEGSTRRDQ